MKVTVDGRKVDVPHGASVLDAIRAASVYVPTVCHHDGLPPSGQCRLCMVDVTRPEWEGWKRLVVACMYPASDDLEVFTDTERVSSTRRIVLEFMLARNPNTPFVLDLARRFGVTSTPFREVEEPDDCILCGICTRVCDHLGISAISVVNRGIGREVAPPLHEPPPDCVGCLACAELCPTGYIRYEQRDDERVVWGKSFEMSRCKLCGRPTLPQAQIEWEVRKGRVEKEFFDLCETCKRKQVVNKVLSLQRY